MGFGAGRPRDTFFDIGAQALGSIGTNPTRSDVDISVANILACPFSTDRTDLTGNHILDVGTSSLQAGSGYNNEIMLKTERGSGDVIRTQPSEDAHAIGGTDPVTFGAFLNVNFWDSTSQIMTSAGAGGSANYGLIRFTNGNWGFRGASGGGSGSAWRVMINRSPEDNAGVERWFHVAMRCEDGVNEGTFFWNGREVWTGALGTNGRKTPSASDRFLMNEANPTSNNPRFDAWWGNMFIADSALTDAQIKQLSDESFGHGSPQTAF